MFTVLSLSVTSWHKFTLWPVWHHSSCFTWRCGHCVLDNFVQLALGGGTQACLFYYVVVPCSCLAVRFAYKPLLVCVVSTCHYLYPIHHRPLSITCTFFEGCSPIFVDIHAKASLLRARSSFCFDAHLDAVCERCVPCMCLGCNSNLFLVWHNLRGSACMLCICHVLQPHVWSAAASDATRNCHLYTSSVCYCA